MTSSRHSDGWHVCSGVVGWSRLEESWLLLVSSPDAETRTAPSALGRTCAVSPTHVTPRQLQNSMHIHPLVLFRHWPIASRHARPKRPPPWTAAIEASHAGNRHAAGKTIQQIQYNWDTRFLPTPGQHAATSIRLCDCFQKHCTTNKR